MGVYSGSAFPGPVAWQIRDMEPEGFTLDSIITVVDCINFTGYEDTSYTAKLQAQYSDVILLNKHELVKHACTLNTYGILTLSCYSVGVRT